MPFIPVENVALVELRFDWDNQKVENTLYFETPSSWDTAALVALCTSVTTWWGDNLQGLTNGEVTLREVVATDLTSETAPTGSFAVPGGSAGEASGAAMPNNVTLSISFRTGGRGRSSRGRNYCVGLSRDSVLDNYVLPGFATALEAGYQALIALSSGWGSPWVVVSRFSGVDIVTKKPIPRAFGIAANVVSVIVVDTVIDSQRRRLPGRGT